MQKYQNNVTARNGDALLGVAVLITAAGSATPSTIYSDDGVTSATNPLTTDANGYFEFYTADGVYDIYVSGVLAYTDVLIADTLQLSADAARAAALASSTGATLVGTPEGTVQVALDARAKLSELAATSGSDLVGFTQPGAGATARTMQAKGRESITPEDFGANGDGTGDDYDALAAAVAFAKASGIGVVEVLHKYRYGTTLVIPTGVALIGGDKRHLDSGRDFHLVYTGGDCAISITKTTEASFQHLTRLENLLIGYEGVTANTDGIQQSLSSVLMRNVQVYNFTRHGFNLGTSIFSYYDNLFAQGCGGTGIYGVSTDPVFPGGQCLLMNPQVFRCQTGIIFDNYQTVRVEGGTIALNTQQQGIIRGGQGVSFSGTFFEPQLGAERTYFGNLVEVSGSVISAGSAKNISFVGCNFYAGQSGATARNNYGLYIGNATNIVVKHNVLNGFRLAGVKIVFDTNVVTNYEVGPNYYTDNVADFDRAGSSSQGIDSTTSTRTLTNQNETYSGTSKLTVQGTSAAPMAFGSFNVWVDPDGKFLRKSGAPGSSTDGTSMGLGSTQTTVGVAGAASTLPAAPTGYVTFRQGGNEFVLPYYAKT